MQSSGAPAPNIILNVTPPGDTEIFHTGLFDAYPVTLLNARSGEEAISICRMNQSISMVLLRPELPGLNGFDTAVKIRALRPTITLVMIAENFNLGALRLAMLVGCNEILQTPFSETELLAICKRYMNPADNSEIQKSSSIKMHTSTQSVKNSNMKTLQFFGQIILTLFLLQATVFNQPLFAQDPKAPPTPGSHGSSGNQGPSDAPIDGGLGILLALGAAYGGVKIYKSRKKDEEEGDTNEV